MTTTMQPIVQQQSFNQQYSHRHLTTYTKYSKNIEPTVYLQIFDQENYYKYPTNSTIINMQ